MCVKITTLSSNVTEKSNLLPKSFRIETEEGMYLNEIHSESSSKTLISAPHSPHSMLPLEGDGEHWALSVSGEIIEAGLKSGG